MQEFLSDAVDVQHVNGKGLGLVAARCVEMGELLFVVRCLKVCLLENIVVETFKLLRGGEDESVAARRVVLALDDGSRTRASCDVRMDWFHPQKKLSGLELWSDSHIDLDRVQRVIRRNAHIVTDMMDDGAIGGGVQVSATNGNVLVALWPILSLVNHDCAPSVACVAVDQETIACVAAVSMNVGDEFTDAYISPLQSRVERQVELEEQKGFQCRCWRCQFEGAELPDDVSAAIHCCFQEAHRLDGANDFLHRLTSIRRDVAARLGLPAPPRPFPEPSVGSSDALALRYMLKASVLVADVAAAMVYESPQCTLPKRNESCSEAAIEVCLAMEQVGPLSAQHQQFADQALRQSGEKARCSLMLYSVALWLLRNAALEGWRVGSRCGPTHEMSASERKRLLKQFAQQAQVPKTDIGYLDKQLSDGVQALFEKVGISRIGSAMRMLRTQVCTGTRDTIRDDFELDQMD